MPRAPSGTKPISTWRLLSISHSNEPVPIPTEKRTSKNEATRASPCKTSLARLGNWLKNTAPKNHIQLIPIRERNTTKFSRANLRLRQVSDIGFQLILRPGSVAGDAGMAPATNRPTTAKTTQAMAISRWPTAGTATSKPPATWPSKIATKVPISTMPLPPVSSRSDKTCGKYANLTGPNSVECKPIKKVHTSRTMTSLATKP